MAWCDITITVISNQATTQAFILGPPGINAVLGNLKNNFRYAFSVTKSFQHTHFCTQMNGTHLCALWYPSCPH